jgi:putative ABC transport system permease protein
MTAPPLAAALKQGFHEIEQSARLYRPYPFQVFSYQQTGGETKRFEEKGGFFADANIQNIFNFEFKSGDPKTSLSQKNSIVLTEKTAKRYFRNEDAIGKIINDQSGKIPLTVTGVVKDFTNPTHLQFDYLLSMATIEHYLDKERQAKLIARSCPIENYTSILLQKFTFVQSLL